VWQRLSRLPLTFVLVPLTVLPHVCPPAATILHTLTLPVRAMVSELDIRSTDPQGR